MRNGWRAYRSIGLCVIGLLSAAGTACGAGTPVGAERREDVPNPFAADPLWDDGRAEVNAYEATEMRYGVPRPFTAYHIVVKEDFSRRQLVKADPGHDPADLVTVLKLNQVLRVQTGVYAYHQMTSTFLDRDSMGLLKFTLASSEWCGNSFKELTRRGSEAVLHAHTYWDGQAEATYAIPADPDVILYDQIPLWVRSMPQTPGASRTLRLVPSQVSSRAPAPELRMATLHAAAEESVDTPSGSYGALRWELRTGDRAPDVYWTARDFPHWLVAWDRSDGGRYRLLWTRRLAYWKLNRPGDERHLLGPADAPRDSTSPPE